MLDVHIEFFERALVHQQFDALARRQLAFGVLRLDASRAAAETGVVATFFELGDDVLHRAATLLNVMLKGLSSMAQVQRKRSDVATRTAAPLQPLADVAWRSWGRRRRREALIEIGDLNLDEAGTSDRLDHRRPGARASPR